MITTSTGQRAGHPAVACYLIVLLGCVLSPVLWSAMARASLQDASKKDPLRIYCSHPLNECIRHLLGQCVGSSSIHALRYVKSGRNRDVLCKVGSADFDAFTYMGDPPLPQGSELRKVSLGSFAVTIVTNHRVSVSSLSTDELANVLTGKVKKWSELGGGALPVTVVGGGDTTHAGYLVRLKSGMEGPFRSDQISEVNHRYPAHVIAEVKKHPGGIGYFLHHWGEVDKDVRTVAISQASADQEGKPTAHLPTEENVALGTYPLAYPLVMLTRPHPAPNVTEFVKFATTEGGGKVLRKYHILPEFDRQRHLGEQRLLVAKKGEGVELRMVGPRAGLGLLRELTEEYVKAEEVVQLKYAARSQVLAVRDFTTRAADWKEGEKYRRGADLILLDRLTG